MDKTPPQWQSELFTLRLWPEEQSNGEVAWRGRLQHALTGRSVYFQGWPALTAFLEEFLAAQKHIPQTHSEI